MQSFPNTESAANPDVTPAWLAAARQAGAEDGYRGKRSHARYSWDAPVTVEVLDPRGNGPPAYAYASNISAGGMGLRCHERVEVFLRLRITLDETGESVCGQVRHCTPTPTGFLIGIQFKAETPEPAALRKSA